MLQRRLGASENTYVRHLWPDPKGRSKQLDSAEKERRVELKGFDWTHLHDLCPVKAHQVTEPVRAVHCR